MRKFYFVFVCLLSLSYAAVGSCGGTQDSKSKDEQATSQPTDAG